MAPASHMVERVLMYETVVDILLDTADVQEAMKSVGQSRGRLYAQRAKQLNIEHRLGRVTTVVEEVIRSLDGDDGGEAESLVRRVSRVYTAATAMKDVVLTETGRSIAAGRCEEAASAWRSGVGRYDRLRSECNSTGRVALAALSEQSYVVPDSQPNSGSEDDGGSAVDYGVDSQEEKCADDIVGVGGCGGC